MLPIVTSDAIAATLRSVRSALAFPPPPIELGHESLFVVRRGGVPLASEWYRGIALSAALQGLLSRHPDADAIEICLGTTRQDLPHDQWAASMQDRHRGRIGLEFAQDRRTFRVAPTQTISTNRALGAEFHGFLQAIALDEDRFAKGGGRVYRLGFRQFVLSLTSPPSCTEMYRGNTVVPAARIAEVDVDPVLRDMLTWFLANQDPDGEIPYKYWPSDNVEPDADNPIRRFMATSALALLGRRYASAEAGRAALANLRYNLQRFYQEESELGLIAWDGSVKLGAVALAALAILNCGAENEFARSLEKLTATVLKLRNPDGSFRSFHTPAERNDNQNFYPGEALLYLSTLNNRNADGGLDELILRSLRWYRGFFRADPNPAFVPWHTQACVEFMRDRLVDDLVAYVFEMNDWLLPMQQWGGELDPDLWGRFHDPSHPEYGPPHASSTGVYLEGLCDALALAPRVEDWDRAAAYRTAIQRGIRSIRQLQFRTEPEMYYVSKRKKVFGAIRTEAYDNEVRVDNVQHCAMALIKYAALPAE